MFFMLRIANELLLMKFPANTLKVYCYLLSRSSDNSVIVRAGVIAERCGISRGTVCTAIRTLADMGLLHKEHRYLGGHYIANQYTLAVLTGRFFMVEEKHLFELPSCAFAVYLMLCRCRGRSGKAFPSLSMVSNTLGLCRNTVIKGIKILLRLGLMTKAALRAGKHNLYVVFHIKTEKALRPANRRAAKGTNEFPDSICDSTLSQLKQGVKRVASLCLFFYLKVVHFLNNNPLTHLFT